MSQEYTISIIGSDDSNQETLDIAYEIGMYMAQRGISLIYTSDRPLSCQTAKGTNDYGGKVIDLSSSPYNIDQTLNTTISQQINCKEFLPELVTASDVLIAFKGGYPTLCEIALALAQQKTVIFFPGTWDLRKAGPVDFSLFKEAFDAREAVALALSSIH